MRRLIGAWLLFFVSVVLAFAAVTQINLATQVKGILAISHQGTGASTAAANSLFSGPLLGAAAAPSFKNSHLLLPSIPLNSSRNWQYAVHAINTFANNGLNLSSGGTVPIDQASATSTNPLYGSKTSGTTSGNGANFQMGTAARFDTNPYGEIMAGMSATTSNRQWIVFGNTVASITADDFTYDGLGFRFSTNASDTHWQCTTNNNSGTSNFVDSGITPDTNMHKFAFYYDSSGTTAYFWIDGTPVCGAVTTQVPRSTQVVFLSEGCTTLLNGQACKTKFAWAFQDADR